MLAAGNRQKFAQIWADWLALIGRTHSLRPVATRPLAGRPYSAADGPFEVETNDAFSLKAPNHEIPLRVYRPLSDGPHPVILFSHGIVAEREDYGPLGRFWASHGYLCIHPQHIDEHNQAGEHSSFRRRFTHAHKSPELWQRRIDDLSRVLDDLESNAPESLGRRLCADAGRIGGAGHSCGADLIQIMSGARLHLPPPLGKIHRPDPRLKAALLLSPRGRDWMVPSRRCWNKMRLPMMSMTGSHDLRARRRGGPAWQLEPIRFSPRGGKYGVNIDGANHLSFTLKIRDQTEVIAPIYRAAGADHQMIFDAIKIASLAFWDAHLKDDRNATAYLQSDALPRASDMRVHLEWR